MSTSAFSAPASRSQSRSHLAVAYNNNVHIHPILLGEMFEKCPYSLP